MLQYYNLLKCALFWSLTASISPASTLSSESCNTSVRVFQVTGCLPLPAIHTSRMFAVVFSASFIHFSAIALTLSPVLSSRRRIPNVLYFVPISAGKLILPFNPCSLIHSGNVGWSWSSVGTSQCLCYCNPNPLPAHLRAVSLCSLQLNHTSVE